MNIDKPKKLLEFITIPQIILAVLITLAFVQANTFPGIGLVIVFACECLINIAVVLYYRKNKEQDATSHKALFAFLIGLLVTFSFGIVMMFKQFTFISPVSPESIYLLCNSVSMIYLSAAIIKQANQKEKLNITAIILICLALPVAVYLLLQSSYTLGDISLVLSVGLFCIFIFLLGKLVFIFYSKHKKPGQAEDNSAGYSTKYRILILISAILLPQVGLMINNLLFMGEILGDFKSVWFYIIAAANGMLLLVDIRNIKYKIPVFYLKAVGFCFICYFTIVFIPYMPYGIVGIVLYGLGLLVYVPVTVFIIQIRQLYKDFKYLNTISRKPVIISAAIVGFLTLPLIITINFNIDRINFDNAMGYVNINHKEQPKVNLNRLDRSISQIEHTMTPMLQRNDFLFISGTPILSTVYRHISLNNMYFTEGTVEKLQTIFRPETIVSLSEGLPTDEEPNSGFRTRLSTSEPEYDEESGVYKAWIDLEIKQLDTDWSNEFKTKFTLPDGCFITDYYLYVGNEKKQGIMTDKRSAQVAYESIIRTPKDPGIIYYDNDDTISLKVFPFSNSETRRTGFQVMYSQNESLTIEGETVHLEAENSIREPIALDGVQFIPADYKKMLSSTEREPIYYFLLDAGDKDSYPKHLELAKQFAENKEIADSKYYAVSYQAREVTELDNANPNVVSKGGYNSAYAMEEILLSVPDGYFPIIMLVTENMNRSVPLEKVQLANAFPEINCFYHLNNDFTLTPYKFSHSKRLPDVKEPSIEKGLDYNGVIICDDGKSETIFTNSDFDKYTGSPYMDALLLQKNTFVSDTAEDQISLTKESMRQKILTKNTAFIVMETKEQEDLLLSLQEKFLNGDSMETPSVMMSESGWIVIIAILGIVILLVRRRGTRALL